MNAIISVSKALFGDPGEKNDRTGWQQIGKLLKDEWNSSTYGLVRPFKLVAILATLLFPVVHIDQLMRCLPRNLSRNQSFVATYRDLCLFGSGVILAFCLFYFSSHHWAEAIAIYSVANIVHGAITTSIVWPTKVINPIRSVLVAFWSYAQSIIAFAILYIRHQVWFSGRPFTHIKALYFSAVTATTVGYGDITPK